MRSLRGLDDHTPHFPHNSYLLVGESCAGPILYLAGAIRKIGFLFLFDLVHRYCAISMDQVEPLYI